MHEEAEGPIPAARAPSRWPTPTLVTEQLTLAGFEEVALQRCDLPIKIGDDLDAAVEFNMALGPAGEVLRTLGERAEEIRPTIAAEIRAAIADLGPRRRRLGPGLDLDRSAPAPRSAE